MGNEAEQTMPSSERPTDPAQLPDPYTSCGQCGKRHCPQFRTDPDGGAVISEVVGELVDVEGGQKGIQLDPQQARELRMWLQQRGF